eukprot:350193-Chlamydomonas_euryale.AAC.9
MSAPQHSALALQAQGTQMPALGAVAVRNSTSPPWFLSLTPRLSLCGHTPRRRGRHVAVRRPCRTRMAVHMPTSSSRGGGTACLYHRTAEPEF